MAPVGSDADDRERWAFSSAGPWTLGSEPLSWQHAVDTLREQTQAEVPHLIARRRLPPLRRFAEAGLGVGVAVSRWWLGARRRGGEESRSDLSQRLRVAFERLGPTYIKLGQIISSGKGIFPDELVAEFKCCRDQVAPETFARVRAVIEADVGRPLDQVFSSFEETCLASASIAQVHAAVLRTGEPVVVKVQRP